MSNIIVFIFPILITLIIFAHPSQGQGMSLEDYAGDSKIEKCLCVANKIYALTVTVKGAYMAVIIGDINHPEDNIRHYWKALNNICENSPNNRRRGVNSTTDLITGELQSRLDKYETMPKNENVDMSYFKGLVKTYALAPGCAILDRMYDHYNLGDFQPANPVED